MHNNVAPNIDPAEIMRLAKSPVGQRLLTMLQESGGQELQNAITKASGGDYRDAQKAVASFLSNPEARALLEQLGRQ